MCYPVPCPKCGKTTWAGCGKHKDQVMAKIPPDQRCTCPRDGCPQDPSAGLPSAEPKDIPTIKQIETLDDFKTVTSSPKLVVVDFYAPWCAPCKKLHPIFEKLSTIMTSKGVTFCRVDGSKCDEIVDAYQITGFPAFLFFKNGSTLEKKFGFTPEKDLTDLINKNL